MDWIDIFTTIIIPLMATLLGGSIILKVRKKTINKKHNMKNKNVIFNNNGDFVNGDKK